MIFSCCNENRRSAIQGNPSLNGIDYLEVVDGPTTPVGTARQRTLLITCVNTAPVGLKPGNVLITGGETIPSIGVEWIAPATPTPSQATANEATYFANLPYPGRVLVVRLDKYGDFSPYTLSLVGDAEAASEATFPITETLANFDPQLSSVTFNFKADCGPEFDCAPTPDDCAPQLPTPPPINYLAKDYTTFRQVMLDRMNQLLPAWGATSEADQGIMLAEVVAYACDQLSYRQDAVTTESYLNTARSRISLRRHARLVDYQISEGCNARVWIQINVSATTFLPRHGTRFYTTMPGMPATLEPGADTEQAAIDAGVVVFEPMQEALLQPDLNLMNFYTWGDTNCCLPRGATEATLMGTFSDLQTGDVLIFQEVVGPKTGAIADANVQHRCAVRLTAVATTDADGNLLVDPLFDTNGKPIVPPPPHQPAQTPQQVTEIRWSVEDALPFPVCVSSTIAGPDNTEVPLPNVSVALGNVILADQGLTMPQTTLGTVPAPSLFYAPAPGAGLCAATQPNPLPVRFNPQLALSPLAQSVTLPIAGSPSTPNAIPLSANAPVSLEDGNGFITLQVSADSPSTWPHYFGVVAQPNATPGEFDLAVVYDPGGGSSWVTLENFTGLNLTSGSPQYAPTVLANSQFIQVPSSSPPTPPVPSAFPALPIMLPNSGTVELVDAGSNPYLTIQPNNPLLWPPLFSIVSQQQIVHPLHFNLLLLYTPPSQPQGVTPPVIVEQFNNLSLATITSAIASASDLISVETFEGEPNPSLSASVLMQWSANEAIPAIQVQSTTPGSINPAVNWTPVPDLLGSGDEDTQFVVEIDTDGTASLRFGDGTNGKQPEAGDVFTCIFRVGNGTAGNLGANCLINVAAPVAAKATIQSCTNPMAAIGGVDPETAAQICRRAPQAFLTQERAIIMPDYVNVVERNPQIEDAAAQTRWTGSWYTVFIAAEPQANAPMTTSLRRSLTRSVNAFRLAGQATFIEPPQYIPLTISLTVCVDPDSFAADVERALLQVLGSCKLPSGAPAFFAPQNFILGQPVYLSLIYQAARTVPGVIRVTATVFEPQGQNTSVYLDQGYIPMGPFQVARLDNDPSLPGNGRLTLMMQGGR